MKAFNLEGSIHGLMLILVGMGIWGLGQLSLNALSQLRKCDYIYGEQYTSKLPGLDPIKLEKLIGKPIQWVDREFLEQHPDQLLNRAAGSKVALLCPGDPMIATTHIDLRLRAHARGIPTKLIHGISIHSAVASATGLQIYKFGRIASIPWPYKGLISSHPYQVILENLSRELHTLLLLEIDMSIQQAIQILLQLDQQNLIPSWVLIGVSQLGSDSPRILAGNHAKLLEFDFGTTPHCLVICGQLHFMELEALKAFAGYGG